MTLTSTLRPLLGGALFGLSLGASAAPAAALPTTVTFDTTPRAGQHHRETLDMQAVIKMSMEAGPDATDEQRAKIAAASDQMALASPMKMSMRMLQTLQVGQPAADGWLPMTVSIANQGGQIQVGGKTMPLPNPQGKGLGFVARFNPADFAFEIQSVVGSPELTDLLRSQGNKALTDALQLYKALRERPLKVGESIEVPLAMALPVPLPGGAGAGGMTGRLRYTLARVDRGLAYFDLDMDLKLEMDVPVPAAAGGASAPQADAAASTPKSIHMKISGGGKGTSMLRLADRLPLTSRLTMDMLMTMNLPDNGIMQMNMDMTMQSKGESLAQPAAKKKP